MEENEIINSGCLKFKAGLLNKWLTGYCVLQKGVFRIYQQQEPNSSLLYVFTNTKSWISAKRGIQNSLFVLNATESNAAPSKIFLFDTEDAELLHVWLHGFKMAGWSSAIAGDKFHYHRRSIDIEGEKHADSILKDGRRTSEPAYFVTGRRSLSRPQSGQRDRHCVADPDLSLSRRWDSSRNNMTANVENDLEGKVDMPRFHGGRMRIYHSERVRKGGEKVGRRSDIVDRSEEKLKSGLELVKQVNGSLGRSNSERVAHHQTVKEFNAAENELGNVKSETGKTIPNDRLARHNSAKVVRVTAREVEVTRNVRSSSLRTDVRAEDQNSLKYEGRKTHFELHTTQEKKEERPSSRPIPIQGNKRLSREGRFDYSKIFYDPALSPDHKGILVKPENKTPKTSLVRQVAQSHLSPSEEIPNPFVQSLGTDVGEEERRSDDTKTEVKSTEKLRSLTDSSYSSMSPPTQEIEITNIDTGEKETLNDTARTRKCSSIASEGVADMNLDADVDTPVFNTGTQGTRFTYSESGYCSKESLAANESLEGLRSPLLTSSEVNNNSNNNNNNKNDSIKEVAVNSKEETSRNETEEEEKDSTGLAHSSLKATSDEDKTGLALNEAAGIAETGRTYSDPNKTMTRNLGRPGMMKIEKRSSMTQLLSQIKEKLPGRKNKVARKNTKKDQASPEKPELILWSNAGKWKERYFAFQHNCLLLFKNADFKSPDFALDVRGCSLEIPVENTDQGFLSFKLFERSGNKSHTFAAVTEDSYNELLSILHKMGQIGRQSDSEVGLTSDPDEVDGMDTEEIAFQDAIVPYSDSYTEDYLAIPKKPNKKQASIDSGNDGDTSCFEASDASNAGIDSYAAGWKDKKLRQRKTSIALQQPVIDSLKESVDETSGTDDKGPVASVRRSHRKITHSESSPPSPRHATRTFVQSVELKCDSRKVLSPIDYLNVDSNVVKRSPKNRYSAPDFQKRQSLNICLEEVSRLKEAHENNVYPLVNGKNGKGRAVSLYLAKTKPTFVDENANHQQSEPWGRVVTSSPKKIVESSVVLEAKQSPRPVSDGIARSRPRSTNSSSRLSLSLNAASSSTSSINMLASPTESSDFVEEISEDELRQQTLLMKRRNSLKLQKEVVARKVKALRERLAKNSIESSDLESTDEERNLSVLENRISRIDAELTEINTKVSSPEDVFKENKKKTKQLFSKFKSTQKNLQNSGVDKTNVVTKDCLDVLLTSPSISPRVRKRSLTHNIKLFGQKRNSDLSEPDSNRASMSSIDSFTDTTDGASAGRRAESWTDLKSADDLRCDVERVRKASSVRSVPEKIDEVDGDKDVDGEDGLKLSDMSLQDVNEKGISKEALLRIEEFEQFAVEMTAKRFTDCIDV